jgi:hypothetical protein
VTSASGPNADFDGEPTKKPRTMPGLSGLQVGRDQYLATTGLLPMPLQFQRQTKEVMTV